MPRKTAAVATLSLFFLAAPAATFTLLVAAGVYTVAVLWLVTSLLVS